MSKRELESWQAFYLLYPFDDLHRYHRPAALISASAAMAMTSGDLMPAIQKRLQFLQPEPSVDEFPAGNFSEADMRTMRAFGVRPPQVK